LHLNVEGARAAADQSTKRWRQGRQRSPIDGMPLGIKDIIETVDMPTENGSRLFAGWPLSAIIAMLSVRVVVRHC
jgi:Asp-tRNA(Asn)/Glu-tRNA(Gln) amidotransferase A subunit family amidase